MPDRAGGKAWGSCVFEIGNGRDVFEAEEKGGI